MKTSTPYTSMMTQTTSDSFRRVAKPATMMMREDTTSALQAATAKARTAAAPVMEVGKSNSLDKDFEVAQFSEGNMNLNERYLDQVMSKKLSRSAITSLAFGALALNAAPAQAKYGQFTKQDIFGFGMPSNSVYEDPFPNG